MDNFPFRLLALEVDVLTKLSEDGGFYTREIASEIGGLYEARNQRSKSMIVRNALLSLRNFGMASYLDDQKPVCWIRTPKGTKYLVDHEYLNTEDHIENLHGDS